MTSPSAPFPPLVAGGEGLEHPPAEPVALRRRMAEVYSVPEACVLPIRGVEHGLELVLRRVRRDGDDRVAVLDPSAELQTLADIYGVALVQSTGGSIHTVVADGPIELATADSLRSALGGSVLVLDESTAEFEDTPSLAAAAIGRDDLVVLRSLSIAFGLAGAPCGALIASPKQIERYRAVLEPHALSTPVMRLAEAALSPSRALANEARIDRINGERRRLIEALGACPQVLSAIVSDGPAIELEVADADVVKAGLSRYRVSHAWRAHGPILRLDVSGDAQLNDRALAAVGAAPAGRPHRRAEVIRDTKETRIAVAIDLDTTSPKRVHTGIGFYDHMLDQVATHGGFSLVLACEGDLEIDPHHTIEDCALAFGAALKQALGERRGIGRFGFVLPMDETEAKVSIDLGGRPYAVFEGTFVQDHIGEWPTQMTSHVFRSLAESLGAAIHVAVVGENDHHKVEACFKAFGRALRQAIRVEGDAVPSTKGVL